MEEINWAADKAWMLKHWYFIAIPLWLVFVVFIFAFIKGANIPEEAIKFSKDFNDDFEKEPLVEQGRDIQKKHDTFKLFLTWPIELYKWIRKRL